MPSKPATIGLIAGGKQFPLLVARGVKEHGHRLVAVGFTGHSNMEVAQFADEWRELKLGKLGKLIRFFKDQGVERIVMAGTINKPRAMDVGLLDMRAMKLVFSLGGKGDSSILGALAGEFEREGMPVSPAHELVPELLTPKGVLTSRTPTEREWDDLRMGWKLAKQLGRMDIGQCLVLREGIVAAVEALEGTDNAIERGCSLGGEGCVAVKVFKPGQQERIDLPSAGTDTVMRLASGKGACIGLEAGRSLFFDQDEAVRIADENGICIVGLSADEMDES